jgi:hypothetical protein
MKEFFLQMLNAKDPSVSSSRFLSVGTVLVVLYVWAFVSLWTRTMHDIPIGVYTFVAIVVGGKTLGMFAERPAANTSTTTETKTSSVTGDKNEI